MRPHQSSGPENHQDAIVSFSGRKLRANRAFKDDCARMLIGLCATPCYGVGSKLRNLN